MHERQITNPENQKTQLGYSILDAANNLLDQNIDTLSVTYAEAQAETVQSAGLRSALRAMESVHHTFGPSAGAINSKDSYHKLLLAPNGFTGDHLTYGMTYTASQNGAWGKAFTLYITREDTFRVLGVFTNGTGAVWTRDAVEHAPGEFEQHALRLVDNRLAGHLAPLLRGILLPNRNLEEELATIRLSLLDGEITDANQFVSEIRDRFNKRSALREFEAKFGSSTSEMSIERMRLLDEHLRGAPLTITIFE